MKRLIRPKFEKTQSDYKLWGLSIPKLPNGHIPHIINRNRPRNDTGKESAIKTTTVLDSCSTEVHLQNDAAQLEPTPDIVANSNLPKIDKTSKQSECEPDHFTDIVFSFISSNDQHYVVRKSGSNHIERELCESPDMGNDYEVMSPKLPASDGSDGSTNTQSKVTRVHKSELTFYVSATSLKGSNGSITNITASNYDLPPTRRRSAIFITQHKSLNDINNEDKENDNKYQNSASLDNLSQVCNLSLKNTDSKRSITSLPELNTIKRTRKESNNNPFPKIAAALSPKLTKPDYSNYFDHEKAIRLKNRISALYTAKSFKSKKRFSKAWCGFKEWLDNEKFKLNEAIHKSPRKVMAPKSTTEDYPESDFSEYEDIDQNLSMDSFRDDDYCESVNGFSDKESKNEADDKLDRKGPRSQSVCNSVFKLNLMKDRVVHINDGDSMRHSRSQPSVLMISEPILVKINCENVEQDSEPKEEQTSVLSAGSSSPPFDYSGSECTDFVQGTAIPEQNEQGGFSELKIIVKNGSTASKELVAILQQRAETERQYACGILRVVARARRASKGTVAASVVSKKLANDMEKRAQIHREFSNRLVEEVVRPLQRLISTRDSIRKQVERDVGVSARRLEELRVCEARCKKLSHGAARFNERVQDTCLPNGYTSAQEVELRKKKTKSEEAAIKTDVEYYMACLRAERARVELETTVSKGMETLLELEEDRLSTIKRLLKRYLGLVANLGSESMMTEALDIEESFELTINNEMRMTRRLVVQRPPSMHLPDFYCQHVTLAMNKERRRQALYKILQLVKNDMERERKSKQVLEKLSQTITTPNFGPNDSQHNVTEKLYHMRSIITYLEGARIQAMANLANLAGQQSAPHPLTPHLKMSRDRNGLQQTILTIPPWLYYEYKGEIKGFSKDREICSPPSSPPTPAFTSRSSDRGAADGVSIQHYSDIDESCEPPERPPPPKLNYETIEDNAIVQSA